jgi:hypothetical protein
MRLPVCSTTCGRYVASAVEREAAPGSMDAESVTAPAERVTDAAGRVDRSLSSAKGLREHAANGMASAITVSRRLKVKQFFPGNIIGGCSVKVVSSAKGWVLL